MASSERLRGGPYFVGHGPLQFGAHHPVIVGYEVPTGLSFPSRSGYDLAGSSNSKRVLGGK